MRDRSRFAFNRFVHHLFDVQLDDAALRSRMLRAVEGLPPGRRLSVQEVQGIGPRDFLDRFQRSRTPVVMRGLAREWPAVQNWSLAYLRRQVGDAVVSVMDNNNDGGRFNLEDMRLGRYLDLVEAGDTQKYLRLCNLL
jgi:hypothetical protein